MIFAWSARIDVLGERSGLKPVSSLQTLLKEPGVLLNLKTVLLLGTLLFCGSGALQAATAPAAPAPAAPAQPELLVEGGRNVRTAG